MVDEGKREEKKKNPSCGARIQLWAQPAKAAVAPSVDQVPPCYVSQILPASLRSS